MQDEGDRLPYTITMYCLIAFTSSIVVLLCIPTIKYLRLQHFTQAKVGPARKETARKETMQRTKQRLASKPMYKGVDMEPGKDPLLDEEPGRFPTHQVVDGSKVRIDLSMEDALKKSVMEDALKHSGVISYVGFRENAYRLIFDFEDHYPGSQHLLTVLPHGKVENNKMLKPEKEKGLLAYGFAQNITNEVLAKGITEGVAEKEKFNAKQLTLPAEERKAFHEKILTEEHRECAFIWPREDGTNALVQTWTTNYNAEWKRKFSLHETNPATSKFETQAVEEFHQSMIKLFGPEASTRRPQYAVSQANNNQRCFFGTGHQLIQLLRRSAAVRDCLNLDDVTGIVDGHSYENGVCDDGFIAKWVNGKKETGTKDFHLHLDNESVMYVKQGWETMACTKPKEQFLKECVVIEDVDGWHIPEVLLASKLPDWIINEKVAMLFLDAKELLVGAVECPKPIPMDACVGPALVYAHRRAAVLWLEVFFSTAFAWFIMQSRDGKYPWYMWISFGVMAVYAVYCEFQCLKYFMVPFVNMVHGCRAPMFGHLTFNKWLIVMTSSTLLAMLSLQTNALFMLETLQYERLHPTEVLLWKYLMDKSQFGRMVDWTVVRPSGFVFVFWLISLTQVVWPLLLCLPLYGKEKDGKSIKAKVKYDSNGKVRWQSYFGFQCSNFQALLDLSYAGGMAGIGCATFAYPLGRMTDNIKQKRKDWDIKAMQNLMLAQKGAFQRLTVDAFLKKTLQLKIQVSLYAIHRSMEHPNGCHSLDINWAALFPIIVTLLTGSAGITDLFITCMKKQKQVHDEISSHLKHMPQETKKKGQKLHTQLWINSLAIALIFLCCLFGIGYSVLQIFFLHSCESSLWNITGCIPQSDIDKLRGNSTIV